MKSLDLFLPRVLPHVIGCPDPLARQALVDSAIEFCARTNAVWRLFTVSSVAGVGEYDIEVPQYMEVTRVLDLYHGASRLTANDFLSVDDPLALRGAIGSDGPEIGTPTAFFAQHGTGTFSVYPLPEATASNVFTCRASFQPAPNASQLDDVLYSRYGRVIECGAVYRLASTPDQPFTSPATAKLHLSMFLSGVSRAIPDARKGAVVTSSRVSPRAFA